MKAVEQHNNNTIGFAIGMVGGTVKFLTALPAEFFPNLIGASVTALICGACGIAGKELYIYIKRKLKRK